MIKNNSPSSFLSDSEDQLCLSRSFYESTIPFFILIIGVLAISSTAIFMKLALQELSLQAIIFDRLLISTITFAAWNWGNKLWQSRIQENTNPLPLEEDVKYSKETTNSKPWIVVALILALVMTSLAGSFLFLWSLKETTAVSALILSNLTPIFTFLGAWLFVRKKFDNRFLVGLITAVGGSIFLTLGDWLNLENPLFGTRVIWGDGAAFFCALLNALGILLTEKLLKHLSNITLLTWNCAICLIFVAPLVWIQGDSILPLTTTGWFAILGFGLIGGVVASSLIVYSFKHFSSAFLAIVFLLEPFPVAFFGWVLFGEVLSQLNMIGFILISVGIYLAKTGEGVDSVQNS